MIRPVRAWNRFWFAPTSARPLGAFRVLFGLIALANLALLAPDLDTWLTDAGRLRGTEAGELAGPLRWSPLLAYQDPTTVRCAFAATVGAGVLFTIGWRTRIAGVAFYGLMLSIHHRNVQTASGADCLLMILLFYLMLSPCGATYSLDSRRKARAIGGAYEPLVSPWPMRLVAIQISLVYFLTALLKAQGKLWNDGTALHYILNNGESRRFTLGLTAYPLLLNAMTFGAVVLEFALAFLLWVRAARPWMIGAGLLLHGGIVLMINIPIFGELMVASYLAFLTPSEFLAIARAFDRMRGTAKGEARGAIPGRVDRPSSPGRRPAIARKHEDLRKVKI